MDKLELELKAQLAAIEYVLGTTLALMYLSEGFTPVQVADLNTKALASLRVQTLAVTKDAALSDHLSAEVSDNVERILKGVKTLVEQAQKPRP